MTDNKYDRQLRLWGASGQAALGSTCVVLVRATAAGTETLKNLVLPGIGKFLVLDDGSPVTDHTSNFFLDSSISSSSSPNKSRAQMATEYLLELNPDVSGSWKHVDSSLSGEAFRDAISETGKDRTLVLAADCEPPLRSAIAEICWKQKIPLLAVHSYGLIGVVQIQVASFLLLEPKLRDSVPDLRLTCPFPALQQAFETKFADPSVWDSMTSQQYGQVPYPFILLFLQRLWNKEHEGKLPTTISEKQEFQSRIKAMARNYDQEMNFQQAVQNAYLAYTTPRKVDVDYLLTHSQSEHDATMLRALKSFGELHGGFPPVAGKIPDMAASTAEYVSLQEIYRKKAEDDWKQIRVACNGGTPVTDEEVSLLCQNAPNINWLQTGQLPGFSGYKPSEDVTDDLGAAEQDEERPEQTPLWWYIGFAASQLFWEKEQRHPGTLQDYTKDVAPLLVCWEEVLSTYGLSFDDKRIVEEMVRYGNAEVHNIASIVGGVASQEAVKIMTGQYIPIDNTFVFNGIAAMGGVYKF